MGVEGGEPFSILARGPWPRARVLVREEGAYAVPREHGALVEAAWRRAVAEASASGRRLFPGPVLGLTSFRVEGDRLALALHRTDYGAFVGTNLSAEFRATGAPCADALGISVLIEVATGFLLHRRGAGCFEWPLAIDTPGGHVEPGATPFDAALEELESELGLRADDVSELEILGLARIGDTRKPQAVLRARVTRSVEEIAERLESARERFETSELLPSPRSAAASLAASTTERITPAGRAALRLASELDASARG